MGTRWRVLGLLVVPLAIPASSSGPSVAMPPLDNGCDISGLEVLIDGRPAPITEAAAGDRVEVGFDVPQGCANRITLASFVAPEPAFDGSRLDDQVSYDRTTKVLGPGHHTMTVAVYPFAPVDAAACSAARAEATASREALAEAVRRQALEDPATLEALKSALARRSTTVTGPVEVACGPTAGRGRPCDGCVGNADDKDPPGQSEDGDDDHNAGYECDRNPGIGDGNPAHEGCQNFQIDLSYRPAMQPVTDVSMHPSELVFGLFCVRTSGVCYLTDNSDDGQLAATVRDRLASAEHVGP